MPVFSKKATAGALPFTSQVRSSTKRDSIFRGPRDATHFGCLNRKPHPEHFLEFEAITEIVSDLPLVLTPFSLRVERRWQNGALFRFLRWLVGRITSFKDILWVRSTRWGVLCRFTPRLSA